MGKFKEISRLELLSAAVSSAPNSVKLSHFTDDDGSGCRKGYVIHNEAFKI